MRTGIRQVAELAQVSAMTVSRVLRGHDALVQEETRKRVLAAMHELNYVPVRNASQNRHIETYAIGLVPYYVNAAQHDIDTFTYQGVVQQAYNHGYDLLVMLRDEAAWMANRREVRFLDKRSDGFIFISPGMGEWNDTLETLVEHKIPTVVCYHRNVPDGVAWVDPDNEAIVSLAIDCLVQAGHRNIGYLAGAITLTSEQPRLVLTAGQRTFDDVQRSEAFDRLVEPGNPYNLVGHKVQNADPDWHLSPSVLDEIMDKGITGVVCVNDLLALQLMQIAEEADVRVPADLSIVGVDNAPLSAVRGLTTVNFRYNDVGRLAVDAWIDLRRGCDAPTASRVVPVALIERLSVGAPRGHYGMVFQALAAVGESAQM